MHAGTLRASAHGNPRPAVEHVGRRPVAVAPLVNAVGVARFADALNVRLDR